MRLFVDAKVRKSIGLAFLLFFAIPFGMSVTGCKHALAPTYCNGLDSGPVVGQVAFITLSPTLSTIGESLSYGQIGQGLSASAIDCKSNSVSVSKYTYASSNMAVADIDPSTGRVCAGTWNRDVGGGIADFTTCTPPAVPSSTTLVYVTATAEGAVSNAIPVFIHPVVTSIQLGSPSTNCTTDPATNCACPGLPAPTTSAPAYNQTSCVSQNSTAQLIARVYAGGGTSQNITCSVGHLSFAAQSAASVVNIDQNGVATANQPGSSIITASVANSSSASSAGFFSTCPPASIVLSAPGQTGSNINVSLNNLQPLTATVFDKNGVQITGTQLEFVSTTPQTIPASSGSVTPTFPGTGTITAVCQPNACNPAPFSQIGYLGNGTPLTSNGITVTAAGTSTSVIYMGSTQSQYIEPIDFTTGQPSALIKLQYVPNSMVISQDGSTIYLGSAQGMMTVTTASNAQSGTYTGVQGTVLAVSPDGATVVVTDPIRQTVSLVTGGNGTVQTQYGGVGTSAQWTPDSQTVYIPVTTASGPALLTHSYFTDWQSTPLAEPYSDVAVAVPAVGAYFAGNATTDGRSYCPSNVATTAGTPPGEINNFAPLADTKTTVTDKVAATNDGHHILGATVNAGTTLTDISIQASTSNANGLPIGACPAVVAPGYFVTTLNTPLPLAGITASSITGVEPASNSALAFVTYTGASGQLPVYIPKATGPGTLSYFTLGNGATAASAPVAGVFSTDNKNFYVGSSGDNQVHILSIAGTTVTETGVIAPKLPCTTGTNQNPFPACTNGVVVAPNLIAQHPRKVLN
ncbi:MAG: hypothetical protein V4555_03680 [Acidobacteriota bacterium]